MDVKRIMHLHAIVFVKKPMLITAAIAHRYKRLMDVKLIFRIVNQNAKKLMLIIAEIVPLFQLPMDVSNIMAIANLSVKLHILITAIIELR